MNFLIKIIIGFILALLICVIFTQLFYIMVASIVCTGGIALVVWIPLWCILGYVFCWIFNMLGFNLFASVPHVGETIGMTSSPKESPILTGEYNIQKGLQAKEQIALRRFIIDARKIKTSEEEIRCMLLESGWNEGSINNALKAIGLRPDNKMNQGEK